MSKHTTVEEMTILVRRSALLTQDRNDAILPALPSMSPDQVEKLRGILGTETSLLSGLADRTISSAIEQGDTKFFTKLDAYLAKAGKKLRKTSEAVENAVENDQLEDFFNNQKT